MIKTKIFKNKQTKLVCFKVKGDNNDYRVRWDRFADIVSLWNYDDENGYKHTSYLPTHMRHIWKIDKQSIFRDVEKIIVNQK